MIIINRGKLPFSNDLQIYQAQQIGQYETN